MTRTIKDYLASGEVDNIVIDGNIGYPKLQGAEYDNMFLRLAGGQQSLYRAQDQDIHWVDTSNTLVTLTTTEQIILTTLAIDEEILAADKDGSFYLICKLTNTKNTTEDTLINIYDDGVLIGTTTLSLARDEKDKNVSFSGLTESDIASGSVITVGFTGDGVELQGDVYLTKFQLTKAKAAPVIMGVESLESFDWSRLPHTEPSEPGRPWVNRRGLLRVSK